MRSARHGGMCVPGWRVLAPIAVLIWGAASTGLASEPWKERLATELTRVEAGVAGLDATTAAPGALGERVKALHERLVALENAAGLPPGAIEGKDDLQALTRDVSSLATRWRKVVSERTPAGEKRTPSPLKPQASKGKSRSVEWPKSIEFAATANLVYREEGTEFREYTSPNFLMDGYRGSISLSLRARGLVRDVASARVKVSVRLKAPFDAGAGLERSYEISWVPEGGILGDGALRSWIAHDEVRMSSPRRWIEKPVRVTTDLHAEAHVVSVTTKEGKTVELSLPRAAAPAPGGAGGVAVPYSVLRASLEERLVSTQTTLASTRVLAMQAAASGDPTAWRVQHSAYLQSLALATRVCDACLDDLLRGTSDLSDEAVASSAIALVGRFAALLGDIARSRAVLERYAGLFDLAGPVVRASLLRTMAGPDPYVAGG